MNPSKNLLFLCVFTLAFGTQLQVRAQKMVPANLESATVFLDRAQLTHTATVNVESGNNSIVLTGLPSNLDPQSLSVSARGNVVLQGVLYQNNFLKPVVRSSAYARLEDSLEYYRDQVRIHTDQLDILRNEEGMIMANQSIGGQKGVEADLLEEMADFFRQRITRIRALVMREEKLLKTLNKRLTAMQQQINDQGGKPGQSTGEVALNISATSRSLVELSVSYIVSNCGWQPLYDLRATDTRSTIRLVQKGEVTNRTGLDWRHIKLTLSSASPSSGATKPELGTWYLRVYDPPKPRPVTRSQNAVVIDADNTRSSGSFTKEQIQKMPSSSVSESMLALEYAINIPYTIPSDGKPYPIELQQHDLPAVYRHMAVPKLDPAAFLVARVSGWDQYNLLPGEANTYFGGTFVGSTYLDANTTSDTLTISLGRDKNVIVSREKVKEFRGKNLFGGKVKESSGYEISIRNTKSEPITVLVEDNIPLSASSEIEVDAQDLSGGKLDPSTGIVTWNTAVKPNETRKLRLKFEVKYPKGRQIVGL